MKSIFEAMGGTYRQCGDFLIPEIALPDTPENPLGKYGRMRQRYLKEHRRVLYNAMILDGTLWNHLSEVDKTCNPFFRSQSIWLSRPLHNISKSKNSAPF